MVFSNPSRYLLAAAVLAGGLALPVSGSVLLNDSWTDGSRAETNLPTESAVWVGVSGSDGGSLAVAPGALKNVMGTSSRKEWTYFTADNSAPDGELAHNSVTQMVVGDTLTASLTFTLPNGSVLSTGKDFRFGLFFDPTDARVQADVNSDGGGGSAPWTDATGYGIQFPLNTTSSNPFQLAKRTTSNSSLLGSGGAFANAPTGGTPYQLAAGTSYTAKLALNMVSATQMDVTATLLQGNTVLSTQTVSDLGTSFGGTAVAGGLLPGSQGVYSKFDQLFFRMSSNSETSEIDFTNFNVELTGVPEPTTLGLVGLGAVAMAGRRSRR